MMLTEARQMRPPAQVYSTVRPPTTRPGSAPPQYAYPTVSHQYYPQPMVHGENGGMVMPHQVVYNTDGTTTVIVGRDGVPYRYHRYCPYCDNGCSNCGYDAALGLTAGMAVGALMWTPFMWAPFFW